MKTLETDRLILRAFVQEDLDGFYAYAKNPNVGPNAGWKPHSCREESDAILQGFIKDGEVYAIVLKENGCLIGSIGIHTDPHRSADIPARMLGYVLDEAYWGRGLCTEAARRVIRFVFEETDVEILSIDHYSFNRRSQRVIEKCGFTFEGTLRMCRRLYDGSIYDSCCYSMLKSEYGRLPWAGK